MRCLKAFGERIAARDPYSQTAEIQIRVALMNRFLALGTAEIVRVASCSRGKGLSRLRRELSNNATSEPDRFILDPIRQMSGPNSSGLGRGDGDGPGCGAVPGRSFGWYWCCGW